MHSRCFSVAITVAAASLYACGGGGGGSSTPVPTPTPPAPKISSFELKDPAPANGNRFGATTEVLSNGNIVVSAPNDSSVATNNGAVHLYDPIKQTRIASVYGDNAEDQLGTYIVPLGNGNFVISSPYDDVNGKADTGSVQLINGETGERIGGVLAGYHANDQLGSLPPIALNNDNYVVRSPRDQVNNLVNAGSVRLMNGATGNQIGPVLVGDKQNDNMGLGEMAVLGNNNFVIASRADNVGDLSQAGSVRLMDGSTGKQIGSAMEGDQADDRIGYGAITVLPNNNFVIASEHDDVNEKENAGSFQLINGITGVKIGATISGDREYEYLGSTPAVALANNNFVIASKSNNKNDMLAVGSVRLINGSTGEQIGNTLSGDQAKDNFGRFIVGLGNSNFVVGSPSDNVGGVTQAGSVGLYSGTTATQIGNTFAGDGEKDLFGWKITALTNNNFVVGSEYDFGDRGEVHLISGSTGEQLGDTITGDAPYDHLSRSGFLPLDNGNFVIGSSNDNENSIDDAGSLRLINGTTGEPIGETIAGNDTDDFFGEGLLVSTPGSHYISAATFDDVGGISDAGSIQLVDGSSNELIGEIISGSATDDLEDVKINVSTTGDFYVFSAPNWDNSSEDDGIVRLIAIP